MLMRVRGRPRDEVRDNRIGATRRWAPESCCNFREVGLGYRRKSSINLNRLAEESNFRALVPR